MTASKPSGDDATNPLAGLLVELSALTGGLAHEIRNPLSTLKVNLQLLDEDWRGVESPDAARPSDPQEVARRSRSRITTLIREVNRLEQILQDFLQYVGRNELKISAQDLNEIARELADFFRPQAEANGIDFAVTLCPQPLVCNVDPNALKQAILNLLINAQQAMPGGGNLKLALAREEGHARIDVTDTGQGIAPESQQRIFEVYYSTKKGGTGLGLATARRIIREHGGRIELVSQPQKGSCFSIHLPLAAD